MGEGDGGGVWEWGGWVLHVSYNRNTVEVPAYSLMECMAVLIWWSDLSG